ncbi:ABC transporter permease [Bailinhaonella thermotolerans]|uniref:Transport permease protein n=1 Tax=Bailinhaonella thermotolerans TaxID=1070861 RepID=A0A3A4BJF8_9ACTN|nr:ABC transporter permease [Bailinhaonella thermotolerans]RJL35374.1 ABC transporter [Bailinhaonella thermotolerans]
MAHPTVAVLERHLTLYRRLWRASVFGSFVLPVLFLLSIGVGVGGYVGDVGGVSYLAWIVPGVMASSAFQMAAGESTYPVFGDFRWTRAYHAARATPVGVPDILRGWMLYILIRVLVNALVFLGVTALFGALHSPLAVLAPLACGLLGVAVSAPITAFAATIGHDSYFALLFRFVMMPSTLFAGVFFPLEQLPDWLEPVAMASPLWHAVELCRAATLGAATAWPAWLHAAYLLAWAAGGFAWAVRAFRKRLED